MGRFFPEFEDFYVSYGSFHDHIINKLIHIVAIPTTVFSLGCLLTAVNPFGAKDFVTGNPPFQEFDGLLFAQIFLNTLNLNVDFVSGCVSSSFNTLLYQGGRTCYLAAYSNGTLGEFYRFWGVVHALSWIAQLIGHKIFEKRAPALLSNPFNFFIAQDFVIIEIMFSLGWRPDVHERCNKRIKANIKEHQENKAKVG